MQHNNPDFSVTVSPRAAAEMFSPAMDTQVVTVEVVSGQDTITIGTVTET